ncbi:DNA repair protein RecO, partial [Clarias magur]
MKGHRVLNHSGVEFSNLIAQKGMLLSPASPRECREAENLHYCPHLVACLTCSSEPISNQI